uniref:Fatty acid binding protein 1b, tandem duplicate 1 n=1 Tax=Tetraodon nigroviridis TaxID=99883 RepID=H3C222_TETNG
LHSAVHHSIKGKENFEPFMKAIGVPDEIIQQIKDIMSFTEIVQNGNDFKITTTTGPKVTVNQFTIGKETEMDAISGEKIKKTVFRLEDNKLKVSLKNIESVTELVDPNTLVAVMTLGDIVYKSTSKRV